MLRAFALALGQLGDRRVLWIIAKSLTVALLVFAGLGLAGWWGLDWALARWDLSADMRGALALAVTIGLGWLLWRIVALAVLQLFADEVVLAVETRHYPAAADSARKLGWDEEVANALRGAGRALGYNLLALPVALVLLITGIGAPLVFWAVNAVLLGRELQDMAWLRHRASPDSPPPLGAVERFALGGVVAALFAVPFVNFLAPFLGAAAAAHLIHRKGLPAHAA